MNVNQSIKNNPNILTMNKLIILSLLLFTALAGKSQDNKIVAKDAKVTKVGGGYTFTEGPSVAPDGRVFFTDQPNDKIDWWS